MGWVWPPMWALFSENVCENERIVSCRGETAAFIEATKWKGYQFLSSEDVYKNIAAIPDELYGEEPQEHKEQESETVPATSKEMSKASSVARILNLVDNQKAAAIKDYVRTKFGRQLVRTDSEDQNCISS